MAEEQYTNTELYHLLRDLKEDSGEIKKQVKETNGRVNRLENWRWFITGGIAIISVVILPVIYILITSYASR